MKLMRIRIIDDQNIRTVDEQRLELVDRETGIEAEDQLGGELLLHVLADEGEVDDRLDTERRQDA